MDIHNYQHLADVFDYAPKLCNYLINVSHKNQYIYVETPKVACGTIKRTLQLIEVEGDESKLAPVIDLHDRRLSPLIYPLADEPKFMQALMGDDYFVFTFVRNPYSRILSCYLDKLVNNDWERKIRMPMLGLTENDHLSFLEFLKIVQDQTYNEMDIHWKPSWHIMGMPKVKYDFIGRFEHFATDFQKVLDYINGNTGGNISINSVSLYATGASNKALEYYGPEEKRLVEKIYEQDFERFGYGYSLEIV